MARKRSIKERAPSIQRAHLRVTRAWYTSILHSVLLLALGIHLLARADPAWALAALCIVGAGFVPVLGRTAYHGNSFSAFLLLATVLVPPATVILMERDPGLVLAGLPLAVVYWFGLKGANGLRGRRASARARDLRSKPGDGRSKPGNGGSQPGKGRSQSGKGRRS